MDGGQAVSLLPPLCPALGLGGVNVPPKGTFLGGVNGAWLWGAAPGLLLAGVRSVPWARVGLRLGPHQSPQRDGEEGRGT